MGEVVRLIIQDGPLTDLAYLRVTSKVKEEECNFHELVDAEAGAPDPEPKIIPVNLSNLDLERLVLLAEHGLVIF